MPITTEVLVAGGSFAGISAAMQLARARRQVTVIDAGQPRNRFAEHAHGFFGHDGAAPAEMLDRARQQLTRYDTVRFVGGAVTSARRDGRGFEIGLADGERLRAERLVVATGVVDTLPDLPGVERHWGRKVLHCPYCHGYEIPGRRIGVLARSAMAVHQAMLVADWGDVTLFLDEAVEPDQAALDQLARRGVTIDRRRLAELAGGDGDGPLAAVPVTGEAVALDALFVGLNVHPAGPFERDLGMDVVDGPMGRVYRVDERKATNVAGVFAAGDAARMAGNIAFAVADGAMAGTAAHQTLVFGLAGH